MVAASISFTRAAGGVLLPAGVLIAFFLPGVFLPGVFLATGVRAVLLLRLDDASGILDQVSGGFSTPSGFVVVVEG